jgi:hypothetical protein
VIGVRGIDDRPDALALLGRGDAAEDLADAFVDFIVGRHVYPYRRRF